MLVPAIALTVVIFTVARVLESIAATLRSHQALEILSPRPRVHGGGYVRSIRLD